MFDKRIDKYIINVNNRIGQGYNAEVYRGINEKTGEKVTIKMLSKSVIDSQQFIHQDRDDYLREGLFQEVKIMYQLQSPNIVAVLEVMKTNNNYYIVQEYCDGGNFYELLKKRKLLSEKDTIKLLIDILNGFTQLIKNGVTHRNLKPENILIDKQTYKLANFGFAKFVSNYNKSMMDSIVGTPLYMSPQLLDRQMYNSKTDVWSLGIILYEALFGKTPWTARSPPELIKNIKTQPLQFPNDKNQISQKTKDLIIGCLQVDENKRFSFEEIYKHPAVSQYFIAQDVNNSKTRLDKRARSVIDDIKCIIQKEKIDLQWLIAELKMEKDKTLDANVFSKSGN
ncbi:unnamed protein product (macronuclear) [Paramecium tetraurelia]|uniref:Protein kinase domain-containing protein n=1 Tax=Paramecium tetraurelia TaxID=5888 RepID=A0BXV3_PARTE|nr:uncharacterized protein GSPATT00033223001 [Paramecium tetraurelia]CAK63370.1 unnamed protein product [Paramecium tetraurelia]|eukprot:XP_001430768.1 hypothetical protein (macronuclear) [Paramecium tetraurelia strain d4-2]